MIFVAPIIPCAVPETHTPALKRPGEARFVFISRICQMKNPSFVIDMLHGIPGVTLDMYGPVEEAFDLKGHYRGTLRPEEIMPTLQRGHFFILPTLGENFGHVIFEALAAGCPPLLSCRTPWNDVLANEAGWTLPLEAIASWQKVISLCIEMDNDTYAEIAHNAHAYARRWLEASEVLQSNKAMFRHALKL